MIEPTDAAGGSILNPAGAAPPVLVVTKSYLG